MKRAGYLLGDIADLNNLIAAFYKAARGKKTSPAIAVYRKNLWTNLQQLRSQILSGEIDVGKYCYFKIYDPKERMICAATFDERVLHHAIMNVCHPFFERQLIDDSYATRVGKGTYKALDRAFASMKKYRYVAKLDVRKYFDNIRHDELMRKLSRIFKDKCLLAIFNKIIDCHHNIQSNDHHKGIPIGNLTSQYFANYYLSETDHYIKETLRIPSYIRYMDDMLLFSDDKNELKQDIDSINKQIAAIGLELKPPVMNKTSAGVSFLGYKLYPHRMLLNRRSKKRFKVKAKLYENYLTSSIWNEQEYVDHVLPLMAFAQHAYTKRLRKEILEGSNRVLRGGSWNDNARNCRVANRNNNSPDNRNNNTGFRLSLAHNTVSDDHLMNRESSCVSISETENEQSCIDGQSMLVGDGLSFEGFDCPLFTLHP